jgi:hypothetical protein
MDENSFSQEEQEQFDEIAKSEFDKLEAEHKKEIEELGHPEWLVTAFRRLRRLKDALSRDGSKKTNAEIANEIENILSAYPDSLFAYDEQCLTKISKLYKDFIEALNKKENDDHNAP